MRRLLSFSFFCGALALPAIAQTGLRDRYFARYPFDKWKTEGPVSQIKWTARSLPARLSAHQRLLARIELVLEAKEMERHRGSGELVIFVELTDSANRVWRTHGVFDLTRIPAEVKAQRIAYAQDAFILPGDYKLALAISDSATEEHSFIERPLHIAPLHSEPLPDAWRDLPAIEYVRVSQPPDNWYQPYLRGRLNLPAVAKRPVHLDIVMNMTPSERAAGSVQVFRRNMTILIPALKVLSGISLTEGSVDVTLLDLTKHKTWEERVADQPGHQFDWVKFREPLASNNPGIIDVQSLASKTEMLQFFREQVAERLQTHGAKDEIRVVIVLSAPVFLEQQRKPFKTPVEKDPGRRLFYIRDRPVPPPRPNFMALEGNAAPPASSIAADDLEGVVKSLGGRLYSVLGPDQFRKALASILTEISRM